MISSVFGSLAPLRPFSRRGQFLDGTLGPVGWFRAVARVRGTEKQEECCELGHGHAANLV